MNKVSRTPINLQDIHEQIDDGITGKPYLNGCPGNALEMLLRWVSWKWISGNGFMGVLEMRWNRSKHFISVMNFLGMDFFR